MRLTNQYEISLEARKKEREKVIFLFVDGFILKDQIGETIEGSFSRVYTFQVCDSFRTKDPLYPNNRTLVQNYIRSNELFPIGRQK